MSVMDTAAWVAVGGFLLWMSLSPWRNAAPVCPQIVAAPAAAPVEATDDRQERLTHTLCDKEVEILLNSRDLADLIRAGDHHSPSQL